tara:strand:+ start:46 stop:246 length:201 start_codon:yes stop_codon:yes gene_type:complete
MGFGKRQWSKRKIEQGKSAISTSQYHLSMVGLDYESTNPEISAPIGELVALLESCKTFFDQIDELI